MFVLVLFTKNYISQKIELKTFVIVMTWYFTANRILKPWKYTLIIYIENIHENVVSEDSSWKKSSDYKSYFTTYLQTSNADAFGLSIK